MSLGDGMVEVVDGILKWDLEIVKEITSKRMPKWRINQMNVANWCLRLMSFARQEGKRQKKI